MSDFDIFPDSERLATDILVAADFSPFTVDVGTELPAEPVYPSIVISRVGGFPTQRRRLDHPNIQLDVWAETKAAAHDVAQIARVRLHQAEGKVWRDDTTHLPYAVLTGVEDALGLAWQFDTINNTPRYVLAVYFTVHVP